MLSFRTEKLESIDQKYCNLFLHSKKKPKVFVVAFMLMAKIISSNKQNWEISKYLSKESGLDPNLQFQKRKALLFIQGRCWFQQFLSPPPPNPLWYISAALEGSLSLNWRFLGIWGLHQKIETGKSLCMRGTYSLISNAANYLTLNGKIPGWLNKKWHGRH